MRVKISKSSILQHIPAQLSIKPRTTQNGVSENLKIFNSSTDPSSAEYKVLGKSPIVFHIVKGRGTAPALGNLSTRTNQRLTKRQIQRQRHQDTDKDKYKVLPRPNICYIFHKQGVQGFKILYWLSSCDDTDKDKNPMLCIIRDENF